MYKYIWFFATDMITVLVVFAMYSRAETAFQTITISALVIIYMAVLNVGAGLWQLASHTASAYMAEFSGIKKLLNDKESHEYENELLEVGNKLRTSNIQYYIHVVYSWILWVIAVWKILSVVL